MEVHDTGSEVIDVRDGVEQLALLNKELQPLKEPISSESIDTKYSIEKEKDSPQPNGREISELLSGDFEDQNEVFPQLSDSQSLSNACDSKDELQILANLKAEPDGNVIHSDCNSSEFVTVESASFLNSDDIEVTSAKPDDYSDGHSYDFDQNNSLSESSTSKQTNEAGATEIPMNLKGETGSENLSSDNCGKEESSVQNTGKENCQTISTSNSPKTPNKPNKLSPEIPSVDFSLLGKSYKKIVTDNDENSKIPATLELVKADKDAKYSKPDIPEASDTDSVSHLSSVGDLESLSEVDFLRNKVNDLTKKLLRSQEQMEGLLEEKQKWLSARPLLQQKQPPPKQKTSLSSDTAAIVVKFAQSEQQRMKAENRIKELEAMISRIKPTESKLPVPAEQSEPMRELNKALAEARERAENLRHSLKQEEARASDLNAKLTATREAHRSEQKRAAGQVEVINKLNRDIGVLKRQLKDMEKIREREAKRLCDEMTFHETTEKYNNALAEITTLKDRITELENVHKSKIELESKYKELQRAHDDLVSVRDEMTSCVERENQLSEFTRRLTERTAGLQSAHLAAQERLAASEKAVAEASRAAHEATELLQAAEARARIEHAEAAATIAQLEAKISKLIESEASLKAELTREQVEKAALKRKQHGLDRELARLVAQQRKRSIQELRQQNSQKSGNASDHSPMGSNLSLSVVPDEKTPSPVSCHTHEVVQESNQTPPLGNALLVSSASSKESGGLTAVPDYTFPMSTLEIQTLEPNRNLLLNKIDRLQRTNVRLMEKIDFMHEHIGQLTQELQKKTKILQNCLSREAENEGAAVPTTVDANKRQRMRRGGTLMAAIFSGDSSAPASDLHTSLQLNQKLQSVLEDALYKNITLKENVDTLADEVARLKRINSELKMLVSAQHLGGTPLKKYGLLHSPPPP